jgi:hypothetical protein
VTDEKAASGDVMPHKFIAFDVRIARKTRWENSASLPCFDSRSAAASRIRFEQTMNHGRRTLSRP